MNFSEPADVRLVIEGSDPLPAHEVVLRLASPVLRDALVIAEPGADGVKELPLPGDDPAQWKLVLDLIYDGLTGKSYDTKVTSQNFLALAVLADKYDMAGLRGAVDRFMAAQATNSNLGFRGELEWLGIAGRYGFKLARIALAKAAWKRAMGEVEEKLKYDDNFTLCSASNQVRALVSQVALEDAHTLLLYFLGYNAE